METVIRHEGEVSQSIRMLWKFYFVSEWLNVDCKILEVENRLVIVTAVAKFMKEN